MSSAINPILAFSGSRNIGYSPPPVEPEGGEQPVKLLDLRHPEYDSRFETWLDLSLLYEGGASLKARAERLLKKRPREDEEIFSARLDHVTYENILGTGLGWYGAAMFETSPEIFFNGKAPNPHYVEFLSNCDGTGTEYIDFFKRVFQILLTYGAGWVLTDLKVLEQGEEPPQTLEHERQMGLLDPHLACYSPLNVINWQVDKMGRLIWAVIKTEEQQQEFLQKPKIVSTWYYYDRENFRVYQDERSPEEQVRVITDNSGRMAKLINEGRHALAHMGRLPLRRLQLSGGLWLANRAYLQLVDHLNQDNSFKWALFMSNLAMPVVIGDVDPSSMTFSETGYLLFPAGTEYGWSEPEGKSFSHSSKRVEALREECFRSMNLQAQGRSMKATPAMQSGRSKILEMAPARQILSGLGDDLRRHMQDVLVDVKDARKDEKSIPDVRGFVFEEEQTTEEVFAVTSVLNLHIPSRKFEKYVMKRTAKAWMQDANEKEIAEVYNEIDTGPTMDERAEQQMKDHAKMAKDGMKTALSFRPPSSSMPPGRGGDGPTPSNGGEGKGKEK